MTGREQCEFFLLRYVPDAVKDEFVNVGLVLLPATGPAEVRFTRDWSRVKCLDPQADLELMESIETDLREELNKSSAGREFILRKIQDSFSNTLQPSEFKACLAESAVAEADALARLYLERSPRLQPRELSGRQAIFGRMREAFESVGIWRLMNEPIRAENYTRRGDPLKIDCGYSSNGSIKMFHALALSSDVNAAKLLAYSFPRLIEGIRQKEAKQAELTAIVENDLEREDESISFALETLAQQAIGVAPLAQMPAIAAQAAREMRIG
jgi:Protein of unknown function (DUF3037)